MSDNEDFAMVAISGHVPNQCPHCGHFSQMAIIDAGYIDNFDNNREVAAGVFRCGYDYCRRFFVAHYKGKQDFDSYKYVLEQTWPKANFGTDFGIEIRELSPRFIEVFGEAEQANARGLKTVSGPGFRKAMEILVKDFAIKEHPSQADKIKTKTVGQVLSDYIKHDKIKALAKRSFWLGNDETHYERKWVDKDLDDLLRLILATVSWIEVQLFTESVVEDMKDTSQ